MQIVKMIAVTDQVRKACAIQNVASTARLSCMMPASCYAFNFDETLFVGGCS